MLLPSDVARLVLGYLQEEGLSATSQAFIHESPNLKEYAEHTTVDGTVPACVFSIFGKSLTTILNEYMAVKTKETCQEVPAMMTSLWKKLDYTLNQIKSLQNTPSVSAFQRTRSRVGVANMARQKVLAVTSAGGAVCSSVSETSAVITHAHTSHNMLGHATPMSSTGTNRPALGVSAHQQDGSRFLNTPRDSPVHISVLDNRLNPGPMSPGRRKWKRSVALNGSGGPGRSAVNSHSAEPPPEEVVDENFPQLVIQNARDKILGDRSLQEKLAENINKILANEPTPQTSKASLSAVEPDQSIDEILGLQGEIHMSEDAIHDILEQTENDPAFQALFEIFDYGKTRSTDEELADGDISSSPEENDTPGPSCTVRPFQSDDPVATHSESNDPEMTPLTLKMRAGQERKTRKSTAPSMLKKTLLGPSNKPSRIENSLARLLVSHGEIGAVSSAAVDSNRKEKASLSTNSAVVMPMDVDEPLNTPPPPQDSFVTQEPAANNGTSITPPCDKSFTVPSSKQSDAFSSETGSFALNVGKNQELKQAQTKEQPSSIFAVHTNNTSVLTADLPQTLALSTAENTLVMSSLSAMSQSAATASTSAATVTFSTPSSAPIATPLTVSSATPTSATPTTAPVSSTSDLSTSSSGVLAVCRPPPPPAAPDPSATNPSAPLEPLADSTSIVSLKIIVSDSQDEGSSSDGALNQAISSISGDNLPTIYLSSPPKSAGVPGTPKANLDETAQAVSGLQNSEAYANPLSSKAGTIIASPLTGTSQPQSSYIIQLPLDTTNSALQGTPASYFLVTEPAVTDAESRQVILPAGVSKGQPLLTNQYGMTTPTRSTGFSSGSTLILPSPIKPVMLPVSVVGQNALGAVPVVSSQLVAIPSHVPVQQTETKKTKKSSVQTKQSMNASTEKNPASKVVHPGPAENKDQQDAAKGTTHRRILCFDSSIEAAHASKTATSMDPNTCISQTTQQADNDQQSANRTKPAILSNSKPKRRIQTVRCLSDPSAGVGFANESIQKQQDQKDSIKNNSDRQDNNTHMQEFQSADASSVDASQSKAVKNPDSETRSTSFDRKRSDNERNERKVKHPHKSRSLSSDATSKSGSRKGKVEKSKRESSKSREGRPEKRTPHEIPNVTANKENEMKDGKLDQQQQSSPSSSASRDRSPPAVTQAPSSSQSKAPKTPSKASSLAKQAAEMLQDIQGLNSPSTPVKGIETESPEPILPQSGRKLAAPSDSPRTPSQSKKGKKGEGTPKHLKAPNTPDVPTCSPTSEAGSENSINMAAHTLMILSRAAVGRTGSPLRDSLRQEGAGGKSPPSSKNSRKRKQSFSTGSSPAKKEAKRSPSKKKDREKKKLMESFPHDLDVDKFLSSLHYDE
ncbi:protein NPAT [Pholidichthys leucotaenia]